MRKIHSILSYGQISLWALLVLSQTAWGGLSFDGLTDIRGRNGGQSVASFLTLPAGAALLGSNMIAVTGTSDASDVYWAPANTAFFNEHTFGASHLEWLMGLRKEFAAASFFLLDIGTIGVYSQVFTVGPFDHARTIEETRSQPRAMEYTVGGSFSRMLIPRTLAAGLQISFLESRLDNRVARALSADMDIQHRLLEQLTYRFYAKHIGSPLTYSNESEQLPFVTGFASKFSSRSHEDTLKPDFITWEISGGVRKQIDEPLKAAIGAALKLGPHLTFRSGYEHSYGYEYSLEGLSAGLGLDYKRYGIDVGWKNQSREFGPVWAVTVRYRTEELIPKNAEDYYRIARKHLNKKRYRSAVRYAKRSLRVNPNFWQAHQLINETISLVQRSRGTEIGLIYTGNIGGQFLPVVADETSLGGLSRIASVVQSLRRAYPVSIALETGNLIKKRSHPLKAAAADTYLREVDFDAHALGEAELAYGIEEYGGTTDGSKATFVCTNCGGPDSDDLIRSRILTPGKYRIAVLSVIDDQKNSQLVSCRSALRSRLSLPAISSADLRIVIFHGSWDVVSRQIGSFKDIDIAIAGSLEQKFDLPMKIGNTKILSAGSLGRHVGLLRLRFDEKKSLIGFSNKLIPVTSDIEPNQRIEKEITRLTAQTNLMEQGSSIGVGGNSDTTGLLTFLSDRHGRPHVFLKVMRKHAEFPLTTGKSSYGCYASAFSTGKIAAVSDTQNDSTAIIMDLTGSNKRKTSLRKVTSLSFGPRGKHLYAATRTDSSSSLYRVFQDGTDRTLLLTGPYSAIRNLSFSPEGLLAFSAFTEDRYHVFITDTSSWKPLRISEARADHVGPLFSPNGRYLSWMSDEYNFGGRKDLWIHDRHTGITVPITRRTALSSYRWIDNRNIVYASGQNMQSLYKVDIFSRESSPLIARRIDKPYQEHSPRLLRTAGGLKIVYTREYRNGKREIYMVNPDGGEEERIVNSAGSDWLE